MSFSVEFWIGKDIENYIKQLETLQNRTDDMVESTIYPGAGLIATETRKAIQSLPRLDRQPRENKGGKKSGSETQKPKTKHKSGSRLPPGVTDLERKGLLEGLGLATIRKDGNFINTKLGMDGYNDHKTASYPKGHPNAMVARSLASGTSYREPCPFVEPTVARFKDKAEKLMVNAFEKELQRTMNF